MSPRSEEFMQQARDRLADVEAIFGTAHPAVVKGTAEFIAEIERLLSN